MKLMKSGGLLGALRQCPNALSPVNARGGREKDQAGAQKFFPPVARKKFRPG
jgi:hypothetical protein